MLIGIDSGLAQALADGLSAASKLPVLKKMERFTGLVKCEGHWVAIRKVEFKNDTHVKLKVISWAHSHDDIIAKDVLLSRYGGYISARPG